MNKRLAVGGWRLALAALYLVIVGCGRPAVPHSVSYRTTARANEPMRVALLPLVGVDGVGRAAHLVDEALLASIRTLGTHEAVPVAQERARQLLPAEAIIGSAIGTEDLLRLRDALRVDAVLIGRIEHINLGSFEVQAAVDFLALGMVDQLVYYGFTGANGLATDGHTIQWGAPVPEPVSMTSLPSPPETVSRPAPPSHCWVGPCVASNGCHPSPGMCALFIVRPTGG